MGECALTVAYTNQGMTNRNEGYPISITTPAEGTSYENSAMAIIKNGPADEAENAKAFIDRMISERGQNLYIESGACRCPVNKNATAAEGMKAISDVKAFACDKVAAAAIQNDLIKEFMDKIDNAAALK